MSKNPKIDILGFCYLVIFLHKINHSYLMLRMVYFSFARLLFFHQIQSFHRLV